MKTNTSDRLRFIMKEKKLKQRDILNAAEKYKEEFGVRITKQDLSHYVNGKGEPRQDKMYILAKILDVSEGWLMGFDVDRRRTPDEERGGEKDSIYYKVDKVLKQLSTERQESVYEFAKQELLCQNKILHLPSNSKNSIEEISEEFIVNVQSKTAAGLGITNFDIECATPVTVPSPPPQHYDSAWRVSGDSMEPILEDGQIIFVRELKTIPNGEIIVVIIDNEVYVKKAYLELNNLRLASENPKYNDILFNEKHHIKIIGKVIL